MGRRETETAAPLSREQADHVLSPWRFGADPKLLEVGRRILLLSTANESPLSPVELHAWGVDLRRWERAWATPVVGDPLRDRRAAQAWRNLLEGRPAEAWAYLQDRLAPPMIQVFMGVMASVKLPASERSRVRRDLREGLVSLLIDAEDGVAGYLDIALRVLEAGDHGPVTALAQHVPTEAWATAAHCLPRRRSWKRTFKQVWPEIQALQPLSNRLRRHLSERPDALAELLDLHLFGRLCEPVPAHPKRADAPADPVAPRQRALLTENIRRIRGRLRAVLAEEPGRLARALTGEPDELPLEGLDTRAIDAAKRLAWAWARRELEGGFSLGSLRGSLRRCLQEPEELALDPQRGDDSERRAALWTWCLLVVLRGRWDHLQRWLDRGGTGDHDAIWGRLLADSLPTLLREAPSAPGGRPSGPRHQRLRQLLAAEPGLADTLGPTLTQIAALSEGRQLRAAFEAVVRPVWHHSVPLPERGFPRLVACARTALRRQTTPNPTETLCPTNAQGADNTIRPPETLSPSTTGLERSTQLAGRQG